MVNDSIKGRCYNFSLNGKKPLMGWFLIISDDGQEYLVQRNTKLSYHNYRKVYQANYSFKNNIASAKNTNNLSSTIGLISGLALVRIFRKIIPLDLFFGPVNRPMNVGVGLTNIALLIFTVGLAMFFVNLYRKKNLEIFLNKRGHKLVKIGKIKPKTYMQKFSNGIEVW